MYNVYIKNTIFGDFFEHWEDKRVKQEINKQKKIAEAINDKNKISECDYALRMLGKKSFELGNKEFYKLIFQCKDVTE